MNSSRSIMIRNKKGIRKLASPRLRRVRYNLRTLIYLEYRERRKKIDEKYDFIAANKSLDYYKKVEKKSKSLREREKLDRTFDRHSICCRYCGDRMEDLIFDSKRQGWFCESCNDHDPFYNHGKREKIGQFLGSLDTDSLTKLMLASYLKVHSLQELVELSLKDLQKLFSCNEFNANIIMKAVSEKVRDLN